MKTWTRREQLLVGVVGLTLAGYGWMFLANPGLRSQLTLLTAVFAVGTGAVFWRNRATLRARVVTASLALGCIVHVLLGALLVLGDRLWELGLIPALAANWHHFLIGLLGIGGSVFAWSRARPGPRAGRAPVKRLGDEPAPRPSPQLDRAPEWTELEAELEARGHGVRLRSLGTLRRLERIADGEGSDAERLAALQRAVRQEVHRLADESRAAEREAEEEDVLSQAAALLEWGAQKLPELAELDVSDLLMAKAIADIRAKSTRVEHRFVDHRLLRAIHPIDRETAELKCEERARAARDALPLLEANGMRLSEELIAAKDELEAYRSVTGFQVVELPDGGLVTFEGNGRREGLRRAFGSNRGVEIEVRLYQFDNPQVQRTIQRRVERVRRHKGVVD